MDAALDVLFISRMSLHSGPGIRTLVLFKGCPLTCIWCSTPESQMPCRELWYDQSKCLRCLKCISACPEKAISEAGEGVFVDRNRCTNCGICTENCYAMALSMQGKEMHPKEVFNEIIKDKLFFKNSGGGVTLSGGEPLAQIDRMKELLILLQKENINIGLDTTGYVDRGKIEEALVYADFFLWDLKCMDSRKHKELTGVGNEKILENLEFASNQGAKVYLRYPIIPGMNDGEENLRAMCEFAQTLPSLVRIDLLPVHHLGRTRYAKLGKPYPLENIKLIPDEEMQERQKIVNSYGLESTIGG